MRGHDVIFGDVDFKKHGTVTEVKYPDFEKEIIYYEVANLPPIFKKYAENVIVIDITLIIKTKTKNRLENEITANTLTSSLISEEPKMLKINNKYCDSVVRRIDKTIFSNSISLKIEVINLNGCWYSEEKTQTLTNGSINVETVKATTYATIEFIPKATTASISINSKKLSFKNLLPNEKVFIDLRNKSAMQLDEHAEIELNSDFPVLIPGNNPMALTNGSGVIKFRGVILP